MKDRYQEDLQKHYNCIKDNYNPDLLTNPTQKHLETLFEKRTKGLSLDDFRNMEKLTGEKKSLLEKLDLDDREIIRKFAKLKTEGHTGIFKPFTNFLKNKSKKLKDNVSADFLAFLLDFPQRPRTFYYANNWNEKKYSCQNNIYKRILSGQPFHANVITVRHVFSKPLTVLISLVLILILILLIRSFFEKNSNIITIDDKKYSIDNTYYYYRKNGKIKIISREELTKDIQKEARPVTPLIFDEFYSRSGKDTTQEKYRNFKTKYFKNKEILKFININTDD